MKMKRMMDIIFVKELAKEYLLLNGKLKNYSLKSIQNFLLAKKITYNDKLAKEVWNEVQGQIQSVYANLDVVTLGKICDI